MIERPKLVVIIVVLSIAGLAGLYAYASCVGPIVLTPGELDASHEGKLVEVEGVVTEARITTSGFLLIDLADLSGPGEAVVFVDSSLAEAVGNIVPGDIVRARGMMEMYKGESEVVPSAVGDITVVQRDATLSPEPRALLSSPSLFEGLVVREAGVVGMTWEENGHWCKLDMGDYGMVVRTQASVISGSGYEAEGEVCYDEHNGWWYLDETTLNGT